MAGQLYWNMVQLDDAAFLVSLSRPDRADFAGGAEPVCAVFILANDARE